MMTLIGIILFLLSISAHEIGHAFAMKRCGVPIREICILGLGPKLLTFRIRRWFGDTPIRIRLFPVAAYVRPDNLMPFSALKLRDKAYIFSAGIMANLVFAGVLLLISCCLFAEIDICFWMALVCLAIGSFPRVMRYFPLLIGLVCLIVSTHFLITQPIKELQEANGSLVAVTQLIHSTATARTDLPINSQLGWIFIMGGLISIAIGACNSLPFFTLDGGKLACAVIISRTPRRRRRLAAYIFQYGTMIPFFILILSALWGDIWRLVKMVI